MRAPFPLFAILLAALPALADDAVTGAEFEAYVEGRTLTYHDEGLAYGIEQYLPGRRVRWAFIDDQCLEGYWYEDGADICFVYEDSPEPVCWQFWWREGRLAAQIAGATDGRELYEAMRSEEPLACLGPDLGV